MLYVAIGHLISISKSFRVFMGPIEMGWPNQCYGVCLLTLMS